MLLHSFVTAVLFLWALAYFGLVVFSFVLATPEHWRRLVAEGRIRQEYADYIARMPRWVVGMTGFAAATRLGGAVGLALQARWALPAFAASLVFVSVIMFRGFFLAGVGHVIRRSQVALEIVFYLLSVFAVGYAWLQISRGLLT